MMKIPPVITTMGHPEVSLVVSVAINYIRRVASLREDILLQPVLVIKLSSNTGTVFLSLWIGHLSRST